MSARRLPLLLALAPALALGGCVAGMVAGAAEMAMQAARGHPQSNAHLKPQAEASCSAAAASYGTVHVIDVVQDSIDKIVVWGTVDDGKERRSFECGFKTSMIYFKLRPIRQTQPPQS